MPGLAGEGLRTVHVLSSEAEIAEATIVRTRLDNDRRDETGPFDVVGDVHGCRAELETMLGRLGYTITRDDQGRPTGAHHEHRRMVFVGDLVDRGPDTPGVLRLVMGMVAAGDAWCVSGNHEAKLLRALNGRQVRVSHGLGETLDQLGREDPAFQAEVRAFCDALVSHYVLDGGALVVAHAGLIERYQGRTSGRVRSFCLYGDTTGETDEYGLPVRLPWARDRCAGIARAVADAHRRRHHLRQDRQGRVRRDVGRRRRPDAIIDKRGLRQISDEGAIEKIVDDAIAANPAIVAEYRAGKEKAFNSLVGKVMAASKGKANPAQVNAILKRKLG